MAGINEDRDRQVIPLWRSFDTTTQRGELTSLKPADQGRFSDELIQELIEDWEEKKSLAVACDLISVALTLGRFKTAANAADFIISSPSATTIAKSIALQYLAEGTPKSYKINFYELTQATPIDLVSNIVSLKDRLQIGIREVRQQLIAYPRNPILWVSLARLYTSVGVQDKAERAIRTALTLSPENRFVLRAASRFYLHQGFWDRAHRLLANSTRLLTDPWILSAEIATADAIRKSSRNIKFAKKLIELQRHTPFHLSELASAIGTLESRSGNLRIARPLINFSLLQPAENSIAQAAWLYRNVGKVGIEKDETVSFEANAWFAWRAGKWKQALLEATRWHLDQPFSSRPAFLAAHLASVLLEDYEQGILFARQGLLSNPHDFALQNGLAFSLARQGKVTEAAKLYQRIDPDRLDDKQRVVFLATSGLIAFRSGDVLKGRLLYRSAIDLGKRIKDLREPVARIYYAFEELRIGSPTAEAIRKEAIDGASVLTDPSHIAILERLKSYSPR